jgi:hypothetical protein
VQGGVQVAHAAGAMQGGQVGASGGGDAVTIQESLHLNVTQALDPRSPNEAKNARPPKRHSTTSPTATISTKKKRKLTQAKLSDYFP